jgi:hypothetical protein
MRVLIVGFESIGTRHAEMHKAILSDKYDNVCSYSDGMKAVSIIDDIDFKDLT